MGKQDNVTGWRVGGGQGMAKEGSVGLPEVVGDGEMEIVRFVDHAMMKTAYLRQNSSPFRDSRGKSH